MTDGEARTPASGTGTVTPERFARVRAIFEAALDQPARDRQGFVKGACAGDAVLQREVEAMLAADATGAPLLDRPASTPSSSAPDEGRFPAGTVLAGRYRILGRLGQGGMGEVYRAHDLILNQTVALKFLAPAHLSEAALARFRNEVRIARQVSHPNVCRVYDLGMVEGLHFLSMEYIDGEDLASLLRRIGRLPQDKAIEFTRKICAGLGAAHERGVLHRDLKPANIMIDGRGQPRITDFGLAGLAAEIPLSDLRSGTPAYMSPEQKAGKDVTVRSDLYSLGLVLHEMFTGKARKDTQSSPSELVKDLDPAIERLILRCLEEDPKRRPGTALNVAMALPGADPIAAALAAGETPSPEMVAASQEKEGFSPRAGVALFAALVVAVIVQLAFGTPYRLLRLAHIDIPPDGLAFRAQDILRTLGYPEAPRASAFGFECCDGATLNYANSQERTRRDSILASHRPPVVNFWYRQHRDPIVPEAFLAGQQRGGISYDSPANIEPGMVRMRLDATGRLLSLEARPTAIGTSAPSPASSVDWSPLFVAARLDPERFTQSPPRQLPSMPFDYRSAWAGTYSSDRTEQVHVEAAAWQGRPVYFSVSAGSHESDDSADVPVPTLLALLLMLLIVVCGTLVARHNLRTGRGDRHGAAIIAPVPIVAILCDWALRTPHLAQLQEIAILARYVSTALFVAALYWLSYIAVEPYMRRYWPQSLISWNRLLSGRARDPLVASHVLVGIAAWMVMTAFMNPLRSLLPIRAPETLQALDSAADFTAYLTYAPAGMLEGMIVFLLMVVVFRLLARRRVWIADVAACIVFGLTGPIEYSTTGYFVISAAMVLPVVFGVLWLIQRFGLVAMLSAWLARILFVTPFTPGSWYAGRGLAANLILVAVAGWALWVIFSDRRQLQREPVT
jgi:serine/threonine-protein kinase